MTVARGTRTAAVLTAVALMLPGAPVAAAGTATDTPGVTAVTEVTALPDTMIRGADRVYRVTYGSTDALGEPVETKATLYVPTAAREDGTVRLLAYAHGTSGVGADCGIGLKMGTGGRYDDWLGPWLDSGYAVVVPEYAGLGTTGGHAYSDGETAAVNTLDAVRAARQVYPQVSGVALAPGVVVGGGSQGAQTSVWVNRLAATHAPQETLVGTSASSLPADIASYVGYLSPGVPVVPRVTGELVTYVSYLLAGMENAGHGISGNAVFTDRARDLVDDGQQLCYREMVEHTAATAPGDLVTRPLVGTAELAELRGHTAVPDGGFSAPVLVQQGDLDVVTPRALVDPWVARVRDGGTPVELRTYPLQGHGLSPQSERAALAWSEALDWPVE